MRWLAHSNPFKEGIFSNPAITLEESRVRSKWKLDKIKEGRMENIDKDPSILDSKDGFISNSGDYTGP